MFESGVNYDPKKADRLGLMDDPKDREMTGEFARMHSLS